MRKKMTEQWNRIAFDCKSREPVCHNNRELTSRTLNPCRRTGVQRPAQIRPAQVRCAIARIRLKLEDRTRDLSEDRKLRPKSRGKSIEVQVRMYGIASSRMRQLKVEHLTRRDTVPCSSQRNPR
jgi:hypothetical protein